MPLTGEAVKAFLETVDSDYWRHYKLRFYTGLRSCKANDLEVRYLDLDRR